MDSKNLIEIWLKSVGYSHSNSARTNSNYAFVFEKFIKFVNQTPEQIIAEYENAEINRSSERTLMRKYSQKLQLWIIELEKNKIAPSTIRTDIAVVMSFFKYNDLRLGKVPVPKMIITYHNRDITREEISQIIALAPLRERAYMVLMAQSGLRPCTVTKLRVKDIEKILAADTQIPCKINVRKEIEKGKLGEGHPSFIAEDGVKYLKNYLGTRQILTGDSLLFAAHGHGGIQKELSEKSVSVTFRKCAKKLNQAGSLNYKIRPNKPSELRLYNLRKFFRKFANQMGFEHVNYLMNHKTPGSDAHYIPGDVEFYRELYAEKAMPFLRIETPTPTENTKVLTTMQIQHKKELEILKTEYGAKAQSQIDALQQQIKDIVSQLADHREITKSINEALAKEALT